jgi:flagellar biosynthesis/type III secretory pathway M-ring protein FliF/YscJ
MSFISKNNETYKYLVNQITEQVEHDAAVLEQMNVAVTVNLTELDETDKAQIRQLIATAASTDIDNVFVYNSEFAETPNNPDDTGSGETARWSKKQIIIAACILGDFCFSAQRPYIWRSGPNEKKLMSRMPIRKIIRRKTKI